jgi:ankyrin repeat protein
MKPRTVGVATVLLVLLAWSLPQQTAAAAEDLRLVTAAQKRDISSIRQLLKQGVNVNAPQPDGATALAWAAHWDDLPTAELLLAAGANPNAANELGMTPLMLAASNGNSAMVEKLLNAGANAALARSTGETALLLASRVGSPDVVKALIAHGADVNAKTRFGDTALMFAAAEKHPEVASILVELGAKVGAQTEIVKKTGKGMTEPTENEPAPQLINKNQAVAVAQLPKDGDYDPPRPEGGFTPLLHAAVSGDLASARLLVAGGADVNQAAADGATPLIVSIVKHHEDIALFLLEKGADPNVSEPGYTALHCASVTGQMAVAKALLERGADANAGVTMPLRLSAAFIPYNPDLLAGRLSQVGATPFMQAAKAVNVPMMRLLVAGGADPRLVAKDGTSAIMLAAGLGKRSLSDMFAFIQYYSWDEERAIAAIAAAIELGGDVNAANKFGETALHGAVYHSATKVMQFLVEKGANINAANWADQTPLRAAQGHLYSGTFVRYPEAEALLVKLGADPKAGTQLSFGIAGYVEDKLEPSGKGEPR